MRSSVYKQGCGKFVSEKVLAKVLAQLSVAVSIGDGKGSVHSRVSTAGGGAATIGGWLSVGQPHSVMSSSNIPPACTGPEPESVSTAVAACATKLKQISSQPLAPSFVAVQLSFSHAPLATLMLHYLTFVVKIIVLFYIELTILD